MQKIDSEELMGRLGISNDNAVFVFDNDWAGWTVCLGWHLITTAQSGKAPECWVIPVGSNRYNLQTKTSAVRSAVFHVGVRQEQKPAVDEVTRAGKIFQMG